MAVKSKTKRKGFSPLSLDAVNFLVGRRARRGRALSQCLPGHPAALESIRSRICDHDQRPAWHRGPDADWRRDRRDPCQARCHRPGAGGIGGYSRRYFRLPDFLAGDDRQQPDGSCRRCLRSRGRGPDLGPVRTAATGAANGTELGLRSCRQCRDRFGGGRGRLCVLAARRVPAGTGFRHADGDRGAVHSRQGHRLQPGERPGGGAPGAAENQVPPATASCSSRGRWSSSVCASCYSISPTRPCCRWWDRSSRPLTPRKRRR